MDNKPLLPLRKLKTIIQEKEHLKRAKHGDGANEYWGNWEPSDQVPSNRVPRQLSAYVNSFVLSAFEFESLVLSTP